MTVPRWYGRDPEAETKVGAMRLHIGEIVLDLWPKVDGDHVVDRPWGAIATAAAIMMSLFMEAYLEGKKQ